MLYTKIRGLEVSKIALGTWAIGGGRDWGQTDEQTCIETIHKALDLGINFIDTAPIYGIYKSEEILGKALKGKRDNTVIATKCGLQPADRAVKFDLSPAAVRAECEASLKRLNTEYIDIYLIHWPDKNTPIEETLSEFTKLKQEGKIKNIGLCNFGADLLKKALSVADISCLQNEYSYLNTAKGNEVFEICQNSNIAFLAYGPLAGGILSGKYKKEPNLPKNDARSFFYKHYKGHGFETAQTSVNKLNETAKKYNATCAQAAINWVLANPNAACVLAGARTPAQIADIAAAARWQMTKEDMDFLNNENN